jgi:hypothetical protein
MEANLKIIHSKVNFYARKAEPAWEYLTNEEREIYAEFLARKKHFLSATRFTTNENKRAEFLIKHKEFCRFEYS